MSLRTIPKEGPQKKVTLEGLAHLAKVKEVVDMVRAAQNTQRRIVSLTDIPSNERFGDQDFLPAPELYAVCVELINRFESQLSHLSNIALEVLWKKEGGKSKGREVWGRTQQASGLVAYYSEQAFIIWIAADHTAAQFFTDAMFQALLFHEMSHISWDPEEGKCSLRGHDFEGFVSELAAFGAWDLNLKTMASQAQQLDLFGPKAEG